jgi:hypothetical protein
VDAGRREHLKAKLLRGTAIVLGALAVLAAILCCVPSVEVYEDRSDCFGHALGSLFAFEHGHRGPCVQSWSYVETRTPVDHPFGMAVYFMLLAVPALVVWQRPRLRFAIVWTVFTVAATFAMVVATFELFGDWGKRTVDLWPAQLFAGVATALVGSLIIVVPLGCLVFHVVTRTRMPRPPGLPEARLIER